MHGWSPVCDGRTGHPTPPHRTAPIRCCFFQFDCFSGEMEIIEHLSLSHRALAQRTRSHPRAITSPRPRLLLELPLSTAALQSPVSRLQLAKSVSAATVCEDEEGAAAVVHLSPPGLLPCTETNSKSTGSRTRNMSNAQPLPVPSQRIVSAPTARYYKTCHAHPFPSHRIHLSLSSASFVCSKHDQSHAPSSLHCQWPVPS